MIKNAFILFSILSTITGRSQQGDSSDYNIYSLIVKSNIPKVKKSVCVFNLTSRNEYYNPWYGDTVNRMQLISSWMHVFHTSFDSLSYSLYRDFDKSQKKTEKLSNSFQLPVEVFLMKKSSFRRLFKKSVQRGWQKFYEKYPNSAGIFEFSDVQYSKAKTKAILYYAVRRNGLNGGGSIVILDKTDGEWKITQEASLWAN